MSPKPASFEEYLATVSSEQREVMVELRRVIAAAAPGAELTISYSMPCFKLDGHVLVFFAAWKKHYSLYPVTEAMETEHAAELAGYNTSGKGTVQFPANQPVPYDFVAKLVKTRINELDRKGKLSR
jgi:uncharacterized protein YdhG (YjbR/CyaY superfamily)